MGILSTLFGSGLSQPIDAVGKILDNIITSDEEKLDKKIILSRLAQEPGKLQAEINKIEAGHRSIFVAGWRPFIGWICACGLGYDYLIRPIMHGFSSINTSELHTLVTALLGMAAIRTVEKMGGRAK